MLFSKYQIISKLYISYRCVYTLYIRANIIYTRVEKYKMTRRMYIFLRWKLIISK